MRIICKSQFIYLYKLWFTYYSHTFFLTVRPPLWIGKICSNNFNSIISSRPGSSSQSIFLISRQSMSLIYCKTIPPQPRVHPQIVNIVNFRPCLRNTDTFESHRKEVFKTLLNFVRPIILAPPKLENFQKMLLKNYYILRVFY